MLLIKHLLELAALIFFAICLGGAVTFCGFRHRLPRILRGDPWHDQWWHQQKDETGPLEGVVVPPQVPLEVKVRGTLARADRILSR